MLDKGDKGDNKGWGRISVETYQQTEKQEFVTYLEKKMLKKATAQLKDTFLLHSFACGLQVHFRPAFQLECESRLTCQYSLPYFSDQDLNTALNRLSQKCAFVWDTGK